LLRAAFAAYSRPHHALDNQERTLRATNVCRDCSLIIRIEENIGLVPLACKRNRVLYRIVPVRVDCAYGFTRFAYACPLQNHMHALFYALHPAARAMTRERGHVLL
jgi:hypothetical protein